MRHTINRRYEALHCWRRIVEILEEVLAHDDPAEYTFIELVSIVKDHIQENASPCS